MYDDAIMRTEVGNTATGCMACYQVPLSCFSSPEWILENALRGSTGHSMKGQNTCFLDISDYQCMLLRWCHIPYSGIWSWRSRRYIIGLWLATTNRVLCHTENLSKVSHLDLTLLQCHLGCYHLQISITCRACGHMSAMEFPPSYQDDRFWLCPVSILGVHHLSVPATHKNLNYPSFMAGRCFHVSKISHAQRGNWKMEGNIFKSLEARTFVKLLAEGHLINRTYFKL